MMSDLTNDLRRIGIGCALGATCLGIAYLILAGAPARYVVVNATAFLLGIVALSAISQQRGAIERVSGRMVLLLGLCLLATAVFGASVDGASRWIWVGPLGVQVSLVTLPVMTVTFARHRDVLGTAGMMLAALALVIQPDRAMAGVLALSLAALTITKADRFSIMSLIVALATFAVTLLRPDELPAVPFVDQILFTAFEAGTLAGAAVVLGAFLLVVPAIAGRLQDAPNSGAYAVFGAMWLGCVAAAALGNYPTPVVGYGGSAILGYLLSLSVLPRPARKTESFAASRPESEAAPRSETERRAIMSLSG